MKLKSVHIENFRAIEELRLQHDPELTVLHGNNAHGKTSCLSAIAVGLGAVPRLLHGVSGKGFLKEDRWAEGGTRVSLTTKEGFKWERTWGLPRSKGRSSARENGEEPPRYRLKELKRWLDRNFLLSDDTSADLPILAFYDTTRAVPDLKKQQRFPKHTSSRFAALTNSLSASTSFRELFRWFYLKENEELREQRARLDHDYRLKELSVVRKAISSLVAGISEPHVELRPLRFVVSESLDGKTSKQANSRPIKRWLSGRTRASAPTLPGAWPRATLTAQIPSKPKRLF